MFSIVIAAMLIVNPAAFDISGIVKEADGAPAAAAALWMRQEGRVVQTVTDAQGRYAFSGAEAAPTDVVVWKDGAGLDGFNGLVVGALELELRLRPPAALGIRLLERGSKPVEGARIKQLLVNDRILVPVDDLVPHGFGAKRSDADGVLSIEGLPQGSHVQFVVSHPKFADTFVAYLPADGKQQNIVLDDGEIVNGRVTGPDGRGLAGASVTVFQVGTTGRRTLADAQTDPEGFYTACVPAGACLLGAWHSQYASPAPVPLTVRAGAEANTCDVKLLKPRTITGSLTDLDGKPFPGVLAVYWTQDALYAETYSKSDGKFRFLVPSPKGSIRIVPPPGFLLDTETSIPVDMGDKQSATLSPIALRPLPEIAGEIAGPDGKAAPSVLIASLDVAPPIWALTDANGQFNFRLARMPETKTVRFRAEHALRFLRADFSADVKKPAPARIALEPYEPAAIAAVPPAPGRNDLSELVDKPAPELVCDNWFNTEPLTIEKLRGNVIVLAFWGAFDGRPENFACIEELRALADLFEKQDGVVIAGIHDSLNLPDEVDKAIALRHIQFPIGRDDEASTTFNSYRIQYIPQIVLIDKKGQLRYWQTGGRLLELIKILRRED